ncbi:hypothetical protein HYC85_010846 [Camellia sinensis]|uniref:Flavin-containing monooxygenase n=1 Tax=Camellia sinensis TaxID=4442 RepID=A0A7J7HJ25_CAMSI|nr:hypothetical protein HYC85_010846 [Camellia sinensis]
MGNLPINPISQTLKPISPNFILLFGIFLYEGTPKVLVMIGNGPSAFDISREIATVAKEVHLSSRSPQHLQVSKHDNHHNIWQHSKVGRSLLDIHESHVW